jgi:hypothetical protein
MLVVPLIHNTLLEVVNLDYYTQFVQLN